MIDTFEKLAVGVKKGFYHCPLSVALLRCKGTATLQDGAGNREVELFIGMDLCIVSVYKRILTLWLVFGIGLLINSSTDDSSCDIRLGRAKSWSCSVSMAS